jgi:hypothetical protein
MQLWKCEILLTEAKNLSKTLIRDGKRLALKKLMEGPGLTADVEIGIELGDHFFIPIIVD